MPKNISLRKTKRLGVVEPSEMDYARLAAYIDGEGCISIGAARKKTWVNESLYVNLSVHNTDARLIDWCAERWGGRVYKTVQTNSKWTDSFGWRVACQQARAILERCLPYFIIKREQAEIAIALQEDAAPLGSQWCSARGSCTPSANAEQALRTQGEERQDEAQGSGIIGSGLSR